jgi:Tfp pilus assembly protein PilN
MALREINLIPDDILFKRYLSQHLFLWGWILFISLSAIFVLHLYKTSVAHAEKSASISPEYLGNQIQLRIEDIKKAQEELNRLDQQKSVMETILWTPVYSRVILDLIGTMNDSTWITKMDIDRDRGGEQDSKMRLTGYTTGSEELGDFIQKLSNRTLFQAVSLHYAREVVLSLSDQHGKNLLHVIEFQIECKITRLS